MKPLYKNFNKYLIEKAFGLDLGNSMPLSGLDLGVLFWEKTKHPHRGKMYDLSCRIKDKEKNIIVATTNFLKKTKETK